MEQAGPKYTQLRKFIYLQEKAFEIYTSFWKVFSNVTAPKESN